jgi:hypothetical protein
MAKESGIGFTVTIDESDGNARDISNDVTSLQFNTSQGLQDITGLDKSAIERLGLLRDGELTLTGVFNDDSSKSHEVFKDYYTPVSGTFGRTVTLAISGQTVTMDMAIESYNLNRGSDGSLVWTATLRLDSGTTPTWN